MGKFDRVLIFSDIDGTYLGDGRKPVPRNDEAIRRFKEEGGTFTVATGRMATNTPHAIPHIKELANFPVLICNGTCVYDYREERVLCSFFMDAGTVAPVLDFVTENYPEVGIRANVPDGFVYPVEHPLHLRDGRNHPWDYRLVPREEWDLTQIYKLVFRSEDYAMLDRLQSEVVPRFEKDLEIIRSEIGILEVQKKGVSKGSTIDLIRRTLAERGTPKRVFCIGDYENDLVMLRVADVAACPENAIDSVKAVSDVIVCHCNEGAIAGLIEYIEAHPELLA